MMSLSSLPTRRLVLSLGVGILGLYLLVAVLAYFVSYSTDLPALEGAPSAVPLNNPTGWVGARLAHRLIYRGFGWAGIFFPLGLLYAGLAWARGRKVRLKYLLWGFALLYVFSTFGGWLVQMGWVEDLLWCGSVGAGLAAWMSLYVGPVGLLIIWGVCTAAVFLQLAGVFQRWWEREEKTLSDLSPAEPSSSLDEPEAQEPISEAPSWYEVVRLPVQTPPASGASPEVSSSSEPPIREEKAIYSSEGVELSPSLLPAEKEEKSPSSFSVKTVKKSSAEIPIEEKAVLSSAGLTFSSGEKTQHIAESSSSFLPPLSLLEEGPADSTVLPAAEIESYKEQIIRTLQHYGIQISRISATIGPTVTLFELVPAPGVRISRIKSLEDDIALGLAALGIRIIAPIPGKGTIGIEVPHAHPRIVPLRELLSSSASRQKGAQLPLMLGKTITNEPFVRDLAQMPHLLIAGATGQGKSVALNCMIVSLLYHLTPKEVRFILIDPKKVEMSLYQGIEKHYLVQIPTLSERIITDVKQALPALQSLVMEMELRYELLKELQVRNIQEYNQRCQQGRAPEGHRALPYLVLIIDELADLMMTAGKEVETPICRLAQLARAVGIHLIVATQRPSVNVITGLIKANFPVRISFRVVSRVDSRVILDVDGAERLIGRGDMLFAMGTELIRLQSGYISSSEIEKLVSFIASQPLPEAYVLPEPPSSDREEEIGEEGLGERDPLFHEAALLVVRSQYGSTSLLQRKLGVGFNRAGRLMDQLERAGIVGPARGSKPREVLVTDEEHLQALL
ncbi:MAG: DNA translocase FtsK [Bacteroidia bacterium]|nr:DNA translocase FtsK [Bacteroidia bacterium]